MPVDELVEEDVEEADEEVDVEEVPPTGDLVAEQAPAPPATLLTAAGIWASGSSDQVAGQGLATSLRA